MSERKVLNKYYPPDFDPSLIPRLRLPNNRQYAVRLMSPCNMRCNTCGDYIARGKKFNMRKETVDNETYLDIKVYRFYFKCPLCMAEITFKTDPKNMDYEVEHGVTPNFKALKLAELQAKHKEEEEMLNPMKLLENRTKASRLEMENIEALEDLKEMSQRYRHIDYEDIIKREIKEEEVYDKRQEEEHEAFVRSIFPIKRLNEKQMLKSLPELDSSDSDDESALKRKYANEINFTNKANNLLEYDPNTSNKLSKRKSLKGMVKVKKITKTNNSLTINYEKSVKLNICAYSDTDSDNDY